MSTSTVALISALAAAATTLLTLAGVVYVARQLRGAKRVAAAEFLLRIEAELREHRKVHLKLRPGGEWTGGKGPTSPGEWAAVEAYMGLFERVGSALIDPGIIDLGLAKRSYGYRIANLVANPVIRQTKVEQERDSWTDFIRLQNKLLGD
jgi:hypothetical protein